MNILLREKNDPLNSLIGQSFNEKSKLEAEKILDEIHIVAQSRTIGKKVLCYVVDKDEIKGVGGSTLMKDKDGKIVSNLILDPLGRVLALLFRGNPAPSVSVGITDEDNIGRAVRAYTGQNYTQQNAKGCLHKVGSGSTAPTRTDIDVETDFGTAPESANVDSSDPVFDSASGTLKSVSSMSAGGSGTINESVMKNGWNDTTANLRLFSMFRDIISPAVSFLASESIVLEYKLQL